MKVIIDKKNELEIEITGETHTLCNALRKTLMEDKDVEAAAYVIEHPIIGEPKLYIKAKNPKKSLKKAAETLQSRCGEFKELIDADADGKTTGKKKAKKSTKKQQKNQLKKPPRKPPRRPPKKPLKRKNEPKKFRSIKQEIRILGVDDAPFVPHTQEQVMLIGTVFRAGMWLDGVLRTFITVDGNDATDSLIKMVNNSRHLEQLRVMMLDGITFGGFNVVDIHKIFLETGVPVIVIMRKYPDLESIKKALKKFSNWENRWNCILEAGEIYKIDKIHKKEPIYMQTSGIGKEDAQEIVILSSTRSAIPEPIRAAHIIAAGVTTGESKGNA